MIKTLRPYQKEAIDLILQKWVTMQRILYVLATGGGKTFTMFSLIELLLEEDAYIVMAVKKRNLVFNLAEEAEAFGLPFGIFMSGEPKNEAKIQICSIDTLHTRSDYPNVNKRNVYLFIDEADESNNDSYHTFRKAYPEAKELGVTATPYNELSFYDDYVETITVEELVAMEVLTPARYIVPKKHIDAKKVPIKNGEFSVADLDNQTVVGDVVENWLLHGEYRLTMVFTNSVAKSKEICAAFNASGIRAVHVDAATPEEERREIIRRFKAGEITVLCNVKLFTRGTNIIEIGCMVDAGLTTSINLFRQKIGRGVRSNPIYDDLIFIDHAGNCLNHGPFEEHIPVNLAEGVKFKKADIGVKMSHCSACLRAYFTGPKICPYCGHDNSPPEKPKYTKKNEKGELVEITKEEFDRIKIIKEYKKEMFLFMKFDVGGNFPEKRGEVHVKLIEKYGLQKLLEVKEEVKLKKWHVIKYAKKIGKYIDTKNMGLI